MGKVLKTMDTEKISKTMDDFEQQFEDFDVVAGYQEGGLSGMDVFFCIGMWEATSFYTLWHQSHTLSPLLLSLEFHSHVQQHGYEHPCR